MRWEAIALGFVAMLLAWFLQWWFSRPAPRKPEVTTTLDRVMRDRQQARHRLLEGWDVDFYRLLQDALPDGVCVCRLSRHTSTGLVHDGGCPIHNREPESARSLKWIHRHIEVNREREERQADRERFSTGGVIFPGEYVFVPLPPAQEYVEDHALCEPEPKFIRTRPDVSGVFRSTREG